MEWDKASVYRSDSSAQFWLSVFGWFALGMMGLAVLLRMTLVNHWLAGEKVAAVSPVVVADNPAPLPDLLPFPLQLPNPEQIAAWRDTLVHWGPISLVWALLAIASGGIVWLVLTLLFRLLIWRPRSCGKFTLSHAQEMATQTMVALVGLAVLASGYFVPPEYLVGLVPAGVFIVFCTAVPGEKDWFTWGRLLGEWRDALRWRPARSHYYIPYDPPPHDPPLRSDPVDPKPASRRGRTLSRLRRTLEKVNAQLDHPSTHPNQREAARVAQRSLLNKISALDLEE